MLDYYDSLWLSKRYDSYEDMDSELKRLVDSKFVLALEYRTFEKSVLGQLGRKGKGTGIVKGSNLRWDEKTMPIRSLMFKEDSFKYISRNKAQYSWRESDSQCLNPFVYH